MSLEACSEVIIDILEVPVKSKYASQLKYDKNKRASDPEYRAKKNEQTRLRNKERYENDPEYRERQREKARLREAKIREFYKIHRDLIEVK